MLGPYYELAIIAAIVAGIGFTLWKGGQGNPVGTGKLQHDMTNVRSEVNSLGARIKNLDEFAASKIDLEHMGEMLREEKARIERLFSLITGINNAIGDIRSDSQVKTEVISGLSESVRVLSDKLAQHSELVDKRLGLLENVAGDTRANRHAIEAIAKRLDGNDSHLDRLIAATAEQGSDIRALGKNLDRIYAVVVEKGMKS